MTQKHTPGPWEITYGTKVLAIRSRGALGYLATTSEYNRDEQLANARLIAAAPEMLAALKSVCNYLDGMKGPFNHELLNLKDVIAKAEGRS